MNTDISKVVAVSFPTPSLNSTQKVQVSINDDANIKDQEKKDMKQGVSETSITSLDDARKIAEEGNKILNNVQRNLQFKVDDSTKKVVMSIVDKVTGEVIRQVPSEEVLVLARRVQESSDRNTGSLVEDKA